MTTVSLTLAGQVLSYVQRKGGRVALQDLHNNFSRLGFSAGEIAAALTVLKREDLVTTDPGGVTTRGAA